MELRAPWYLSGDPTPSSYSATGGTVNTVSETKSRSDVVELDSRLSYRANAVEDYRMTYARLFLKVFAAHVLKVAGGDTTFYDNTERVHPVWALVLSFSLVVVSIS